jgi:hypothetical protein
MAADGSLRVEWVTLGVGEKGKVVCLVFFWEVFVSLQRRVLPARRSFNIAVWYVFFNTGLLSWQHGAYLCADKSTRCAVSCF